MPKPNKNHRSNPFSHLRDGAGRTVPKTYISDLRAHITLPGKQKQALLQDHARAIGAYLEQGLTMEEALYRLKPARLGGFYAHSAQRWFPLDTSAKIYPLSMKHAQVSMFRESIYLKESVCPEILQMALTYTIKRFPSFATTVKRGFFWHYLDSAKRRFPVEEEKDLPCRPLSLSASGAQSFRVLYHRNRISAEFFHGLTDGTGALVFLKCLTAEYLRLMGHPVPTDADILDPDDTPHESEFADDFLRHDPSRKGGGFMGRAAAQMGGRLSRIAPCRVLHFQLDAEKLRETARACGATVTEYMLTMMFLASKYACETSHRDIQIQVPVNMRKFSGSRTVRNYALYCTIALPPEKITTFADTLPLISARLRQGASRDSMEDMAASALRLTRGLRLVPLAIKTPVARIVYGFIGDVLYTNTLSNLGMVRLPEEMARHIEKMDFVLNTNTVSRASCSMVTFGSAAVFTISKLTADPSYEEKLHALLTAQGLEVSVSGSEAYEG